MNRNKTEKRDGVYSKKNERKVVKKEREEKGE